MPNSNAFHSSCWILYRSSHWLTETDFCSILKISLHLPQNEQKEWTAVSLTPAFIPQNTYYPFVIIKPLFLGYGNFFESEFIPGHALGVQITKNAQISWNLRNHILATVVWEKQQKTPNQILLFCMLFVFQETLEYKMVFCFYEPFILAVLRLPNQVTFADV